MKYGSFINMRFLSSFNSNMYRKKPFPTKWILIPSLPRDHRFLYTQESTSLGEGHSLVSCPIIPRSSRLKANLQGSSIDRAIVRMVSILFTNVYWFPIASHLLHASTNFQNMDSSGGRGGFNSGPPPWAMVMMLCADSQCLGGNAPHMLRALSS